MWAALERLRGCSLEDRDVAILLDTLAAAVGRGPLVLGGDQEERRRELLPIFRRVSEASADHPNGPVPTTLLQAIAWTESRFSWREEHRPKPVGVKLGDVPGRGFQGFERALGVMQVWSGHDGKRFGEGWWPEPGGDGVVWTTGNWQDPTVSIVTGAAVLLDAGLGPKPAREVLRAYSGARPENHEAIQDYVEKVTGRHLYLSARELFN